MWKLWKTKKHLNYPNINRISYPNDRPNKNEIFGKHSGESFGQYSGSKLHVNR
jgi:hypothetical protein